MLLKCLKTVQAIKQNVSVKQNFYFCNTDVSHILKETGVVNNNKKLQLWLYSNKIFKRNF